jgi:hypothetical protein
MRRPLLLLSLLALAACVDKPAAAPSRPDPAAEPAAPSQPDPAPEPTPPPEPGPVDRREDPAFALKTDGDHYVGLVVDRCPEGFELVQTQRDLEPKLAGDELILRLWDGGCPQWAGFAVIPGEGSPLPFKLCEDREHNPCKALGSATWSFAVGDALKRSGAAAVVYDPLPAE